MINVLDSHKMNNFYKVNNRYNTKNVSILLPSETQQQQQPTTGIHTTWSEIAAAATSVYIENKSQTLKNQLVESSYQEKINKILTTWQQIQQEKKQQIQLAEKKQQKQENVEFHRIVHEELENQLKRLECQEEKQYQLMEQLIKEQLEQEYQTDPNEIREEDYIDELKQFEQLETIIEQEQERDDTQFRKNKTWKRHEHFYHLEQLKKYQHINLDVYNQKY
jgi:hypothetical protein